MENDKFVKHGVRWEFSRGSVILRNGYQVPSGPICPTDKADLVPQEIIENNDDLYWRDNILGEQVFRCPDCNKIYRFPFNTLEDLHRDVHSSYLGALRRGEFKKEEKNRQGYLNKKSHVRKENIAQNITNQFLGPINQLTQATKHRDTIQNNNPNSKNSLLDWIKKHIIAALIVTISGGLIIAYLTDLFGWG